MEILSRKDAIKDIKKIKDSTIKKKIKKAFKKIEGYKNVHEMILDPQCKKMSGSDNAYRVRVGHYRVGFYATDDTIIIHRVLNRQDMYNKFPERGYVTEEEKELT